MNVGLRAVAAALFAVVATLELANGFRGLSWLHFVASAGFYVAAALILLSIRGTR